MSTLTETLRLIVSGDSKGAVKALDDVKKKTGDVAGGFKASTAMMGAAGLAIAGAVVAYASKSVGVYQDWGKQLKDIQRLTGATAEQAGSLFSQMKLTAGMNVDAGTSLAFYAKNLGAAHNGTGAAAKAFASLNINLKDANGEWRTGADILPELRDKLAALPDASTRAADAAAILGRGYKTLLPYLTASTAAMKDNQKFLGSIGFNVSTKDMQEFSKYMGDEKKMAFAQAYMQFQMGKLVAQLETKVMPVLLKFMGILNHIPPGLILAVGALAGLVGAVNAVRTAMSVLNGVGGIGGLLGKLGKVAPAAESGAGGFRAMAIAAASSIGIYVALAAAIAGTTFAIYEAVKAWQSMKAAQDQLKTQTQGTIKTDAMAQQKIDAWKAAHPGQALPADYQQLQNYVNSGNRQAANDTLRNGITGFLTGQGVSQFAGGGYIPRISGGTLLRAGEGRHDEIVAQVLPGRGSNAGRGAPSHYYDLRGATFVGSSKETVKRLLDMQNGPAGKRQSRLTRGLVAPA